MRLESKNLALLLSTPEETRAEIAAMPPEVRRELSADWLARVEAATEPDPWVHGFAMIPHGKDDPVGSCGFKGPPTADGVVEIAYGVDPEYQGRGYATEAAAALTAFAFSQESVQTVCAHTLRERNASTRVLTKCGFQFVGEVVDPEDGPVWRWEKRREV